MPPVTPMAVTPGLSMARLGDATREDWRRSLDPSGPEHGPSERGASTSCGAVYLIGSCPLLLQWSGSRPSSLSSSRQLSAKSEQIAKLLLLLCRHAPQVAASFKSLGLRKNICRFWKAQVPSNQRDMDLSKCLCRLSAPAALLSLNKELAFPHPHSNSYSGHDFNYHLNPTSFVL